MYKITQYTMHARADAWAIFLVVTIAEELACLWLGSWLRDVFHQREITEVSCTISLVSSPAVKFGVRYISYKCCCRPFGRLWWDETVPTVVTRAEPHNQVRLSRKYSNFYISASFLNVSECASLQIILHPNQARVLTVRENARLQGFPDYYKMFGPIKEK